MNFDDWIKELISDYQWYSLLRMYKEETIKKAAEKVFAQLVADKVVDLRPMSENRKHVYNIVTKNPGDKVIKNDWVDKAIQDIDVQKKEEWKPVSWQKRAEYLKMVQAEIDRIGDNKIRPLFDGEAEEKGQYEPAKPKAKCEPARPLDVVIEHMNKVNAARRKFFLERKPDASEEEIQAYISKFNSI